MKADAATHQQVAATIAAFTDAYLDRDLDALMACFLPDDDVVMYGTGADEKRVGLEAMKAQALRDWEQSDSVSMDFSAPAVSAAGAVAWASMEGSFKVRAGGQEFGIPARLSLVLENRDGRWLIAHSHFSTPAAGQAEGSSF
jgi:uncharacterized protein (TIGR02246 family)